MSRPKLKDKREKRITIYLNSLEEIKLNNIKNSLSNNYSINDFFRLLILNTDDDFLTKLGLEKEKSLGLNNFVLVSDLIKNIKISLDSFKKLLNRAGLKSSNHLRIDELMILSKYLQNGNYRSKLIKLEIENKIEELRYG